MLSSVFLELSNLTLESDNYDKCVDLSDSVKVFLLNNVSKKCLTKKNIEKYNSLVNYYKSIYKSNVNKTLFVKSDNIEKIISNNSLLNTLSTYELVARNILLKYNLVFNIDKSEKSCNLAVDIEANNNICSVIFNIKNDIKNCKLTESVIFDENKCKLDYKYLIDNYSCNLTYSKFENLIKCGVTIDTIKESSECGLKLDVTDKNIPCIITETDCYNVEEDIITIL